LLAAKSAMLLNRGHGHTNGISWRRSGTRVRQHACIEIPGVNGSTVVRLRSSACRDTTIAQYMKHYETVKACGFRSKRTTSHLATLPIATDHQQQIVGCTLFPSFNYLLATIFLLPVFNEQGWQAPTADFKGRITLGTTAEKGVSNGKSGASRIMHVG
jgi:hypothetical protein